MKLDPKQLYEYFESIGIKYLYHANTVPTACTFIRAGGILSRGAVEEQGLYQTPQSSDEVDQEFNVWNDIFLDCNDLHKRFGRENRYGPVLFKYSIELLLDHNLPEVWITKDNPIRWNSEQKVEERYFINIDELKDSYSDKSYIEMITLRFTKSPLSFKYLKEIILDNPKVRIGELILYKDAAKILKESLDSSDFDYTGLKRTTRNCIACYCHSNYLRQYTPAKLKIIFRGNDGYPEDGSNRA
ncbi:hypothetical protein PBN151_5873 [Paenibacillus sp. NAIST15-1]|nr:hypothetical protein PBN151_5873 [Paenibacillus sp. NAIST15-1]